MLEDIERHSRVAAACYPRDGDHKTKVSCLLAFRITNMATKSEVLYWGGGARLQVTSPSQEEFVLRAGRAAKALRLSRTLAVQSEFVPPIKEE
jgi:hypothetical protein